MKKQSGNILIFLLIGVLFIGGLGMAYYLGAKKSISLTPTPASIINSQTPQPTPTPADTVNQNDETASWKTYANVKYGFSIKYPRISNLESNELNPYYTSFDKQIFITVESANKPPCTGDCSTETLQKEENIKVNQSEFKKYTGIKNVSQEGGYFPPQSFIRYEIIQNSYKYMLEITELGNLSHSYEEGKLYPANRTIKEIPADKLQIFNQMLSTFKFTN